MSTEQNHPPAECKHVFHGTTRCVHCHITFQALQEQLIANLVKECDRYRLQNEAANRQLRELQEWSGKASSLLQRWMASTHPFATSDHSLIEDTKAVIN